MARPFILVLVMVLLASSIFFLSPSGPAPTEERGPLADNPKQARKTERSDPDRPAPVDVGSAQDGTGSTRTLPGELLGPSLIVEITVLDATPNGPPPKPIPGAKIELGFGLFQSSPDDVIASGVTGTSGVALIEVPWEPLQAAREAGKRLLLARVDQLGYLRRTTGCSLPIVQTDTVRATIRTSPGKTLAGTLLGPEGAPFAGRVDVLLWNPQEDAWVKAMRTLDVRDGRFSTELTEAHKEIMVTRLLDPLPEDMQLDGLLGDIELSSSIERAQPGDLGAMPFRALVVGKAMGSARRDDVELAYKRNQLDLGTAAWGPWNFQLDSPIEPIDLLLSGEGRIAGRVSGSAGEASSHLELLVWSAELWPNGPPDILDSEEAKQLAREGQGVPWSLTTTDEDGHFDVRGLRPGLYHVSERTQIRSHPGTEPPRLTARPAPSNGGQLQLKIARPYLVVHLTMPDGSPYAPSPSSPDGIVKPKDWRTAQQLGLVVEPAPLSRAEIESYPGRIQSGAEDALWPKQTKANEFIYEVEEGRHYWAGMRGSQVAWTPTTVVFPMGAGRMDVTVPIKSPSKPGTLVLEVYNPLGQEPSVPIKVEIQPFEGGPTLNRATYIHPSDDSLQSPWPARFDLPPGKYRLIVRESVTYPFEAPALLQPSQYAGVYEGHFKVEEGMESHQTVRMTDGAKLHIHLDGEIRATHDLPANRTTVFVDPNMVRLTLHSRAHLPEMVLIAPIGASINDLLELGLAPYAQIGSTGLSGVFQPGNYLLIGQLPSGQKASAEVELREGGTLEVTLDFGPE
jgi:hypothetical protein